VNFKQRDDEDVNIGMTPLIDVVFILLLFFMVTTTFNQHAELRIDLPEASAEAKPGDEEKLEIAIDAQGRFYVNGREIVNTQMKTLQTAIIKEINGNTEISVSIRADAKTPHQSVITAMDAVGRAGLTRLSIATTQNKDSE
jgi:biopolymer transport protein ExbD